jgi:hypothetical protein
MVVNVLLLTAGTLLLCVNPSILLVSWGPSHLLCQPEYFACVLGAQPFVVAAVGVTQSSAVHLFCHLGVSALSNTCRSIE